MCIVTITLPMQSKGNNTDDHSFSWLCTGSIMVRIHMTAHCLEAVMCIVTITPSVQSQVNERSCVLLPLQYLWLCIGNVMVTIHMTAHCPGFVQVL
jgi:hypothetical protein